MFLMLNAMFHHWWHEMFKLKFKILENFRQLQHKKWNEMTWISISFSFPDNKLQNSLVSRHTKEFFCGFYC